MTSAAELFYSRRSRFGRNSDSLDGGSGLDSPSIIDRGVRTTRGNRSYNSPGCIHARRDRLDSDRCDPLSRVPTHPRQPSLRNRVSRTSQEHESFRLEQGGHHFASGNASQSDHHSNVRARMEVSRTDRLPGAVLLAKERLFQRLRGLTISSNRRNDRNLSGNVNNPIGNRDDIRFVNAGYWQTEASREGLSGNVPLTNSTGEQPTNRAPGLMNKAKNLQAKNSLHVEMFFIPEEGDEQSKSGAFSDCSICMESFSDGELLMCLPCEHRYHFWCMEPWLDTRKDCPYCRRSIDITTEEV